MENIITERLIIRNFKVEDFNDLYEFNSDEKVNPNAGCSIITDKDKLRYFLNKSIENKMSFAIELKSENKIIGTIGMDDIILDDNLKDLKQRYIGYRFNSLYWGQGYGTEAAKVFINYLFEVLNLDLIWSSHFDFNYGSKRIIEKCGLKYTFKKDKVVKALDSRTVTEVFYKITKDNYYEKR